MSASVRRLHRRRTAGRLRLVCGLVAAAMLSLCVPRTAPAEPPAPAKRPTPTIDATVKAAGDPNPQRLRGLLRAGARVNGRTARKETPLQVAAAQGHLTNVLLLLEHGAEVNAPGARGITALGWAARGGHESVARALLDAGAGPDAGPNEGRAPLSLAVSQGRAAIVELLLERGSAVLAQPKLAGAVFYALGEANSVQLTGKLVPLLKPLVAESARLREAAAGAIATSNAVIAEATLHHLGEVGRTRDFQTALLMAAARRRRPDLVSTAIAGGADVNARDPKFGTPLAAAAAAGDAGIVAALLSAEVDVRASGVDEERLYEIAAEQMADYRAADLIAQIGSPDVYDENGQTPLFRAAERGDIGIVNLLLRRKVNPNATMHRWPGDKGWTALMIAAAGGHTAVVDQLLEAGAAVDQRNGAGRTALHFAAWYGRSRVAVRLIQAGADPEVTDDDGRSPRDLASLGGDMETVETMHRPRPSADQRSAVPLPDQRSAVPLPDQRSAVPLPDQRSAVPLPDH